MKPEKTFNKRLIRFIIWWTILGVTWLSLSRKWRWILWRFFHLVGDLFMGFHDRAKSLGEKLVK